METICIKEKHCPNVVNAAATIDRIRELCQLQEQEFHPQTIVARIRDIVDSGRFKAAGR